MPTLNRRYKNSSQSFITFTLMIMMITALSWVAPIASAQFDRMGGPGGLGVDQKEVDHIVDHFGLTEDQTGIIQSMFEGYSAAFQESSRVFVEEMRNMRDEMGPEGDWLSMMPKLTQLREDQQLESQALNEGFYEDVKTILTEEQMDQWPRYEQDHRRRANLGRRGSWGRSGRTLPGENIDLINLIDTLELPEEELDVIQPTLDQYVEEMDRALIERETVVETANQRFMGMAGRIAGDERSVDPDDIEKTMKKTDVVHAAVLEVNTRHLSMITGMLSPESSDKLGYEFQKRSYPRLYRETLADRYIERVNRLEDLIPEQIELIEQIQADYDERVADMNQQLAEYEKQRDAERQERRREGMRMMMTDDGEQRSPEEMRAMFEEMRRQDEERPDQQLRDDKRDLVQRTVDSIFDILTPEQQAEVPKPEPREDRMDRDPREWRDRRRGPGPEGRGPGRRGAGGTDERP